MKNIHAERRGNGYPLILLHGFCETSAIWEPMTRHLPEGIEVIAFDLPGFGKSELLEGKFSIADIGSQVIDWIKSMKISESVLVGHSLGGYVGLSMLAQAPDLFSAFVLFQSTALADTPEKRENRNKVIEFVNEHGVDVYIKTFVPSLFKIRRDDDIDFALKIAFQTQKATFVGYTEAMRDRLSSESLVAETRVPISIIAGAEDTVVPIASLYAQAKLNSSIALKVLDGVGHMGMLEAREQSATLLADLISAVKTSG
ncbi:MAG: alpha/beta fold hydrolase [Cyclobacteriaceae bacterium]